MEYKKNKVNGYNQGYNYPIGHYGLDLYSEDKKMSCPNHEEYEKKMKKVKKMKGYHDMNGYKMKGDKHVGPAGYWGVPFIEPIV